MDQLTYPCRIAFQHGISIYQANMQFSTDIPHYNLENVPTSTLLYPIFFPLGYRV